MPSPIRLRIARNPQEKRWSFDIRDRVFTQEQGIPAKADQDGLDEEAILLLAIDGDRSKPMATGRLIVDSNQCAHLSRIAVLPPFRSQGIGARVVRALEAIAQIEGARRFALSPHEHLEAFYSQLGYRKVTGSSQVGDHVLIDMEKLG